MELYKIGSKIRQVIALTTFVLMLSVLLSQSSHLAWAQPNPSLMFIENVGQFTEPVRFQTYGSATTLSLTEEALWFTIIDGSSSDTLESAASQPGDALLADESRQGVNLKLGFLNANPQPRLEPFDRQDTHVSYFHGNTPANWQVDVPVWGGVCYVDLYPGVDLEITSQNGQLVQRLVSNDNASRAQTQSSPAINDIALQIEGADTLAVNDTGQLQVMTALGDFSLPLLLIKPADVQVAGVDLVPDIKGNVVINPFSTVSPLPDRTVQSAGVSDLIYSTFLGGAGNLDTGNDIVVDTAGHAYVTGQAYAGFPSTPGAFDTTVDGVFSDAFVAKLNPEGSDLIYATFLGGTDYDTATDLVIDEAGNAYLAGYTTSTDFPTSANAFDNSLGGESDGFAAKFDPTGTALLFATYLGGSDNEFCWGINVDGAGSTYVTGFTPSSDFPTTPQAYGTALSIWYDVFVVKLNTDASDLIYSTLVGGNSADYSFGGVAVDESGSAYVTGYTHSDDFPTTPGTFDTTYDQQEIFVFKLNPAGSDLTYSTFLGGSKTEYAEDIFVDAAGNAYLTGNTRSFDFPTTEGSFDTEYNSEVEEFEGDSFVAKLNPDGTDVLYATFLGGSGEDVGQALVLSEAGYIYVTGETTSVDFPTTPDAFDTICEGCEKTYPPPDVFMSKLSPNGTQLVYSTFLGSADGYDQAYGIAVDNSGHACLTGSTSSANFPTTEGAFDKSLEGFKDVFVAKLATGSEEPEQPEPTPTPLPPHDCAPTTLGTIPVGSTPRGIALDVAKQRAYVANSGSDSVSVIDTSTHAVMDTITGIPSANGIAYDGLHNRLWVTNYSDDQVTPIDVNADATNFTVLPPVGVGDGPWDVVYDPIYGYLYVANNLEDSVSVIDVSSRTVATTLTDNFNQPFHMATTPVTGKVYVANSGNNTVTVIKGTSVSSVVNLYDSGPPYGITVDEIRNIVYVATVANNRIVAIGTLNDVPDQFLGWAAFFRGFGDRNRPVPLRAIAINPDIGPGYDGGHLWATTSTIDGSELNQALFIPKGWSAYFHVPFAESVGDNPSEGIAVDRANDLVYVASGAADGIITVIGDHANQCPVVTPATAPDGANDFDFDFFSRQALANGDVTGDGLVDIFDLTFIASRFNSTDYTADINGDGLVDIYDLVLAASRYGQSVSQGN